MEERRSILEYRYTENCIFKGSCPREKRVGCDPSCTIQPEFYYLLKTSNIPERYENPKKLFPSDEDKKAFNVLADIRDDIEEFVKHGRTLYLWSREYGNGKTEMSIKLMKSYMATICVGNEFKDRCWFEFVPTFLLTAKNFEDRDSANKHITALMKRDLCILDDIGAVKTTEYDISVLTNIINTRYSNSMSTIYTSNLSPEEMQRINNRIADRACTDVVIELRGAGRRMRTSTYERREL